MTAVRTGRLTGLDAARGLAVALMVIDHVCLLLLERFDVHGIPGAALRLVRMGPCRASMPLFVVIAGVLVAERNTTTRRQVQLAAASVTVFFVGLWYPWPDILAVLGPALCAASLIRRRPIAIGALGVVQVFTWPLPLPMYQPGAVVALLALGMLCARTGSDAELNALGDRLPDVFRSIGKRSLTWYVAHLVTLGAIGFALP